MSPRCTFIPPYLLERVARAHPDPQAVRCCRRTLSIDADLRTRRSDAVAPTGPPTAAPPWQVHSADQGGTLPGRQVRAPGQPSSGDVAVDEAATHTEATLAFYAEVLARSSYDGRGSPVVVTVHYERDYDNAFWDGHQLVFGDGDQVVFDRFTKPPDVLAHEFTHGVTQYTAALSYSGQSGALNESMSDVFGILVKQRQLGQTASDADWLIGAGIFLPSINGVALRSMRAPGTAYDDPRIGTDPQVASMDDYVETTDDNGGVHINSGIPNRAFYLAATALGGHAWERAGPIWYAALTTGQVDAGTEFAGFAAATVAAAEAGWPDASVVDAVRSAWTEVGVVVPADRSSTGTNAHAGAPSGAAVVEVRRSGGFAGRVRRARLPADDPRGVELAALVETLDSAAIAKPQPDRYVYVVVVGGREVTLHEHELSDDTRRLFARVLGEA